MARWKNFNATGTRFIRLVASFCVVAAGVAVMAQTSPTQAPPSAGAQAPPQEADAQPQPAAPTPRPNQVDPRFPRAGQPRAGQPGAVQPQDGAGVPPAPPFDPIQEMIKRLDPTTLSRLAGADITVETVGDQIIIKGPEQAVQALEMIIRGLNVDRAMRVKQVEVVNVRERDASELARSIEPALRDLRRPNQPQEELPKVTALSSNILLVSAMAQDMDLVLTIIDQVDDIPDPLGRIELMRFEVRFRKATDVAKELERVITQLRQAQGASKDKSKLQFIPNNANNTIAVTARESEREKIQALINEIDVEPKKGWGEQKLTVFPLLHSEAADLAKVIQDLLTTQAGASATRDAVQEVLYRLIISKASPDGTITDLPAIDVQKPLKIIADKGTNSLIVATPEENVLPMGELIRLLDGLPLAADFRVRLFPLRFADSETIAEALTKMFADAKKLPEDPGGTGKEGVPSESPGSALVYNIAITTDQRTNTLIVSGRPDQLALVATVVDELDRPATSLKFPLRLIPMDYADATQIGKTITELVDARIKAIEGTNAGKSAIERERVFISSDLRTNSLIVSASEENFAEISDIIRQLDQKPSRLFDQIRIITLARLSAGDMQKKVVDLWKRKADLRRESKMLEDLPIVVADERSNSLVIASSREDFDEIQRLVTSLESQPVIDDTQLYKLEFADSTVLAGLLRELLDGLAGQSETFKAPTVIADPRSNAIIVAGARSSLERVGEIVKRLDVESGPMTSVFRVYALKHASAVQLATRVQNLFDARKEGEETTRTPVVVLAEESSNSLIVSASRDDHAIIQNLVDLLDRPSNLARQFEIFPLKLARAATVAEKLEALFKAQGEGAQGRTDVIATQADERTNSIIVWASPSQMANIAEVIAKLDTSTPAVEMMIKVIQLRQALAEDFAKLLEETIIGEGSGTEEERAVIVSFLEKTPGGQEVVRRLLRQDIRIKPDPRTNSLMVMAPADSMAMLEAMIRDFDRIRPITSEVRLFPLVNSDAKTMVEQLTELFNPKTTEGDTATRLVFGEKLGEAELASVGQELRFAADARTNTLIAAGAPVYLSMVEDLVRYLDAQAAESRIAEVYQTKYRPASDLATAVQSFVKQETDIFGTGEDEESRIRRQERQVSIEAVGDAEKGSSSLLVGTSARQYQRTMDLIQTLDRPEPQVMLSVVVAEVSLSDQVDLGVEIAGQDLKFTEDAIVGPNGVVQGSGFDYVGGTDLGAAGLGLGGLNFTVTGEDFSFLFRALQQDSRLEIMSRPVLLVRNGEEGKITIADQVPIVESSRLNDTGQTQSTIGREDVGIILTATPRISPDGYVTIELKQEISNISGETLQLTEGVSSPVFQKREVDTNITVRDGETIVVGGLIRQRESSGENKIPVIGDIPILGALFRTTSAREERTELLVILTADILRTDEDLRQESLQERDRFELTESIKSSPLMEGLRITPKNDNCLGPQPLSTGTTSPTTPTEPAPQQPAIDTNEKYGPKPKIYGPALPRSTTDASGPTPTAAAPKTYGPRIARTDATAP